MIRLKVVQVRSALDRGARQRGTLRALGIRRIGHSVVHEDKPEIRGMIKAVEHLVTVEEIEEI
ncbi:50S ribosomal protein L30 [soil metagenome]|jgi:large subunit ribosomal protein L30|nr:50S ribosomal protein L30 [Actinomycetota bacterium]MDQ3218575.1 50S ribosomal protein L30 [Actinomycetota bacterium]